MTRPDPAKLAEAQRAGDAARAGSAFPAETWVRRLAPASGRGQREQLLEALSPAMRDAAEAWNRR